jgi:hypothetical protein
VRAMVADIEASAQPPPDGPPPEGGGADAQADEAPPTGPGRYQHIPVSVEE